jgi:phosphoglycolate phosphatase-like HAD superfamily hydrolase
LPRNFFDGVIGIERDRRFANKADIARFMLKEWGLDPASTTIVGDSEHNIIAGKTNGLFALGVTYGHGRGVY